ENLEQRALARAVAADDADHLARMNLERHVAERPERARGQYRRAAAPDRRETPKRRLRRIRHRVAQGTIPFRRTSDRVLLAQAFDADGGCRDHTISAKLRSMRRKYSAPVTSSTPVTANDTPTMATGAGRAPKTAQRNPSTAPTIGLIAKSVRFQEASIIVI